MQNIIEQIKVYIEEDKSDYAIMINGSWGCGKTYFIKNDLSYKLYDVTHKPNIYISLFGIRSIEDLYELVAINILDIKNNVYVDKRAGISGYKVDKREYYRFVSLTKEAVAVKKGVKEIISSFSITKVANNVARTLSEAAISFEDYVFIFDDFERSIIDKIELLSFIDSFVEQNNAKVIIVCNEFVLLSNQKEKKNTKKHLTTIHSMINKRLKTSSLIKIVLPNSNKAQYGNYWKYKEKVIGLTINFKYDISDVFNSILNKCVKNDNCREFIYNHKEHIIWLFKKTESNNLRTLEFIFKRFSELYIKLVELNYMPKYSKQYFRIILYNIVASSIQYKEKGRLPEYDDNKFIASRIWTRNGFGNYSLFSSIQEEVITWRSIDDYIKSYDINIESLKEYIDDHIQYINSDSQGISIELFAIMFTEDDREACEAFKIIQDKIYNNEYDINVYPHILDNLFKLYKYLPIDDKIENLKQQILENALSNFDNFSQFSWSTFEYEDSDAKLFKDELYTFLKEKLENKNGIDTEEIIGSDELFGRYINSIFEENKIKAIKNKGYFVGLSGKEFAKRLLILPLKEIRDLNSNLQLYYLENNNVNNQYYQDVEFLKVVVETLEDYLDNDTVVIKKRAKYLLGYTLKFIINILDVAKKQKQQTK